MAATTIDTATPRCLKIKPGPTFRPFEKSWTELSLVECFERQVRATPDRLAVKFGELSWTYEQLNQAANRLARAIVAQCGPDQAPIAFLVGRGAAEIASIFGILKAGKFYVPLDPSFPRDRLTQILEDVQPRALITDTKNADLAVELTQSRIPIIDLDRLSASVSTENLKLPITADDYALVLFTSSSTGRAKGVLHDHRTLLHHVMKVTSTSSMSQEDRFALLSSCGFAASLSGIFASLLNGAAIFPYDLAAVGVPALAPWLVREEITIYHSVPTTFRGLMATLNGVQFPKLRLVRLTGEPVTPRDVELCRAHFGSECVFNVTFGSTEMLLTRELYLERDAPLESSRVPVGYEVADTEVLVLGEGGRQLEPGCLGEIAVKSRYMAVGYWGQPELTNQSFRPDPLDPEQRIYLTGDMGVMRPDGCLEHHGRRDYQAKVRGHRIELAEIEMALLEHDAIKEAVVVATHDQPGEQRLVAYVVPRREPPTVSEMRQWLTARLPSFMMPSAFVTLTALPLTPTGKVNRRALPPPTTGRPELRTAYRQPGDPSQYLLVELWEKMLSVKPIGIDDDFFELGGDSLLAVSLLTQIEASFGRAVPQAAFMKRPTIEGLAAALIELDERRSQPALVKLVNSGEASPLVYLHGDFNGGGYYSYRLARYWNSDRPLYLIHPHGLFTPHLPVTIEAMAADNVETLLAEASGPFVLGGHCNGALVAFEMARQLRARGQSVESLVMIAPPRIQPRGTPDGQPVEPSAALAAERFDMSRVGPPARRPFLLEAYRRIITAYRPAPYEGKLTVLQPAEVEPLSDFWPKMGRDVEIRTISGGHLTSITQHAAEVATELQSCATNGRE
jgi:amino acid adenylation domain-containing protein